MRVRMYARMYARAYDCLDSTGHTTRTRIRIRTRTRTHDQDQDQGQDQDQHTRGTHTTGKRATTSNTKDPNK